MVDKLLRTDQRLVHNSTSLADTSGNRSKKGWGAACQGVRTEGRPVVKERTRMSNQYFGTSGHKFGTIDLRQNDEVQVSAYQNRWETKKSAISSTFDRDMGKPF